MVGGVSVERDVFLLLSSVPSTMELLLALFASLRGLLFAL